MDDVDPQCLWCGGPLPLGSKASAKYCHVNCRVAAYRLRRKDKDGNLARFGLEVDDLAQLRRSAALTSTRTPRTRSHGRSTDFTYEDIATPPAPAQPELLDPIDRWLRTPIALE